MAVSCYVSKFFIFFFNDTATTEIYTLSLHDALPIWTRTSCSSRTRSRRIRPFESSPSSTRAFSSHRRHANSSRSEEHTSELQSHLNLVCRLLLEKKNKRYTTALAVKRFKTTYRIDYR